MIKSTFTDAFINRDFGVNLSIADDYELKDEEKRLYVNVEATAASKTLTLGLGDGDTVFVTNVGGTNAVTVANVEGDTGTSLAKGKSILVIASITADGSTVIALN